MKYLTNPIKNIFNYKGRASVKQFWYYYLIQMLIGTISYVILTAFDVEIPTKIIVQRWSNTILFIPLLSLGFRRIQDTGKTGWLFLIPLLNLILAMFPGNEGSNKYGDPVS